MNAQNEDGDTPLHRAVREGHVKMVNLLLDKGADKVFDRHLTSILTGTLLTRL